jgi:4,5-dihydroxyphthalate decarboxylase
MALTIRLAVRDWDWVTPLALGDLKPDGFTLELHRVADLPGNFGADPRYDAAEMSLSRYSLGRSRGEDSVFGMPHFLMRGFRHRCIVTAKTSGLTTIAQLRGQRIGLAGWQDSGNTWTRAILRREGIEVEDASWLVSRLGPTHPITDRIGPYGRPGLIETVPGDRPLLEMLEAGELAAVFMPFMPPSFFNPDAPLRQLLPDFRQAEIDYVASVGYVPGMHLLGIKPAIVRDNPALPQALSELLDECARIWNDKRVRYADTTPWLLDELRLVARDLPPGWNANGFAANEPMINDFTAELHAQGLTPQRLTPRDLFPAAP